ncbi:small integral membrane protein 26 [Myotis daubentonii]|nr:small integral membrane protein 26 [Myotis daubentonii]XP_059561430.1 small integral membrane protein 26 [Myotis daubentonii]
MHRGQLPIGGSGDGGAAPTGRPAYAPSLGEDFPSSGGAMRPDQASLWYRRMSSVYALGTWTLLGALIFSGRKKSKPLGDEVEQKDVSTYESPESGDELDLRKEITEPPKGFYVETIVTYKEDFVPMTDKILNYWKSWTGGPGPES